MKHSEDHEQGHGLQRWPSDWTDSSVQVDDEDEEMNEVEEAVTPRALSPVPEVQPVEPTANA